MRNWPKTPIDLGGRRLYLCFSLGAVAEAQERFDARGIEVNLLDSLPPLTLANVRTIFPCTLGKYHPELDTESAGALVTWEAVYPIAAALRAAWHAAAPILLAEDKQNRKSTSASTTLKTPPTRDLQWERLWSLARYDLGLSTEEFYGLTIGQLDSLIRRHERKIRENEFMPAQIAACIVNFSMGHPKKPVEPRDFMPSEWAKTPVAAEKPKRRPRQLIATELRETMDAWMRMTRNG